MDSPKAPAEDARGAATSDSGGDGGDEGSDEEKDEGAAAAAAAAAADTVAATTAATGKHQAPPQSATAGPVRRGGGCVATEGRAETKPAPAPARHPRVVGMVGMVGAADGRHTHLLNGVLPITATACTACGAATNVQASTQERQSVSGGYFPSFRLAHRTCAPCGPSARAGSRTKSD